MVQVVGSRKVNKLVEQIDIAVYEKRVFYFNA